MDYHGGIEVFQRYAKTAFNSSEDARDFAEQNGLDSWAEVCRKWNAMSGQNLDRSRVKQIAKEAHRKMRKLLDGIEF